jgi:hypothetical protein
LLPPLVDGWGTRLPGRRIAFLGERFTHAQAGGGSHIRGGGRLLLDVGLNSTS